MTPGQKSHARARAYDVLAELLLHGPGGVDYAILGAIGAVDPQARDGDDLESQFVTAFDLGSALEGGDALCFSWATSDFNRYSSVSAGE